MSSYRSVRLETVANNFSMGPFGSNIKAENFMDSGIPVIRGKNLNYFRFIGGEFVYLTEQKTKELSKSCCFPGDIVLTHRGTIGQVGIIPDLPYSKYVVSQSGMKVTADPDVLDNMFLFYFLITRAGQHELLQNESQVGVPSISSPLTSLKSIYIPLPPLPEQKAIASVLSSLDDKIDLLNRQNKTLESMAETLFRQWFVEEADESWPIRKLGDFISTNQLSLSKKSDIGLIEYLDTGSLTDGKIHEFQITAFSAAPSRARRIVKHNDVLISTVRPIQRHYGIVKNPRENLIVSTGFCVITCEGLDPHYVYLYLTQNYMTEYLHSIAEGSTSTYPSLKPSDIESLKMALPPNSKMTEFSSISSNLLEKIDYNYKQIVTLQSLRDTLLPKLMSGEVRVDYD